MLTTGITIVLVTLLLKYLLKKFQHGDLARIPGETISVWAALTRSRQISREHLTSMDLYKRHGPVVKILFGVRPFVVLSDFEGIYEVLVKKGKEFGGRLSTFRVKEMLNDSGILLNVKPDATWRTLRKISQKHLRQFGDGLSRLESMVGEVAEDMFVEFNRNSDKPFDPDKIIFDTALNSISFLITGQRTQIGDPIVEQMREYEALFLKSSQGFAPKYFLLLEVFSWLKYFGFSRWDRYQRLVELHEGIWEVVKQMNVDRPESESICKVLLAHVNEEQGVINERDAQSAALSLLFAGVTTTSSTFTATVNILAHNPDVQERIRAEMSTIEDRKGRQVEIRDRHDMPYTRAVLLEALRYVSPVPLGVPHKTLEDTSVCGYNIPKGMDLMTSFWNLHHDEKFWDAPYEFHPERFLDDSGEMVPADHPHRTHLMPFGAGTRVCLGESLAMARLFIWLTNLVSRFDVRPAPGNDVSLIDARGYSFESVLRAPAYQVIFTARG